MQKFTPTLIRTGLTISIAVLVWGCSGRRVENDLPPTADSKDAGAAAKDPKDQKIETLTAALSRAQTRIEELDAKIAVLSDKVDSTRLTVDNIAGVKPLKTEVVGSASRGAQSAAKQAAEEIPAPVPHKSAPADKTVALRQDSAVTEFQRAMHLFKSGKYTDAELAFNHFAETYPEHVLAGSAQFYNGESYFMMGEYKLALNEYGKVVSSFSSSPRVASAMVRMSHCYEAVGNTGEATRTLALARDLYEGNPSLEWIGPGRGKKPEAKIVPEPERKELSAAPIEPRKTEAALEEPHGKVMTIGGKAPDDQKIDDLEENGSQKD